MRPYNYTVTWWPLRQRPICLCRGLPCLLYYTNYILCSTLTYVDEIKNLFWFWFSIHFLSKKTSHLCELHPWIAWPCRRCIGKGKTKWAAQLFRHIVRNSPAPGSKGNRSYSPCLRILHVYGIIMTKNNLLVTWELECHSHSPVICCRFLDLAVTTVSCS